MKYTNNADRCERSRAYAEEQIRLLRETGAENPFRVEYADDERPRAVRGGNSGQFNPVRESEERIPDGTYFVFPAGSAWTAYQFRAGRVVNVVEECLAATHSAAGDQLARIVPRDTDRELDAATSRAIIRAVMGPGVDPELVVITRRDDD